VTDLERIKEFYDWLVAKYELEESEDIAKREGGNVNQRLTVGEKDEWFWTVYLFRDGKLINWYVTE
jgi:hypothetical protein